MLAMTTPAIETRGAAQGLRPDGRARRLDLRVEPGEVFGFLGPNGAGKTTAVKLLLGLTRPTRAAGRARRGRSATARPRRGSATCPSCSATRHGYRPRGARAARRSSAGLPAHAARRDRAGPRPRRASPTGRTTGRAASRRGCSSGSASAAALLGDPALVILDEPTSALDPVGRDDVRAIIREARERGSAVLLNSHLLGEVERLCDRVAIVHRGRVVADGALADLLGRRPSGSGPRACRGRHVATALAPFGAWSRRTTGSTIRPVDPDRIPDVVAAMVGLGGRVHAVDPGRRSLEDLFLDLVRDDEVAPGGTVDGPA